MIPQFNFNPSPDFIETLKAGDTVFLTMGSDYRKRKSIDDLETVEVKRVTPKFVIIFHPRIDGLEMRFKKSDRLEYGSISKYPCELYPHDIDTYNELVKRTELIEYIRELVDSIKFGSDVCTEDLEKIVFLIKGENHAN